MLDTEELAVQAAASARTAEEARRLDPDVVKLLLAAGFARHFAPRAFGGTEGTFADLTDAVARTGAACPATAWCASLAANLGRMAAYLPAEGQRAIWEQGPDALVAGSLSPFGKAVPAGDGHTLSGRWPYVSAVTYADWLLLCATSSDGEAPRVFAVPRDAVRVVETWDSAGMRATGSHTVVASEVFVPGPRSFARGDLLTGSPVSATAACHRVPLEASNGLSFAAPLLGAVEGALGHWTAYAEVKARAAVLRPQAPGPSREALAGVLALASGQTDAARLLLERCASTADLGADITPERIRRTLRDTALSVRMLAEAVNRLTANGGTTGFGESQPLQRHWRDVNASATHIALQFDAAALSYAEGRLWTTQTSSPEAAR
ncbi:MULTISPECIES: hydrolase [unclassified Streptomyces]|uniref:hydrolase n=1 Tax=unclassified Streptomyces TaxID=2593676 RepID=UPI000939714A|nr:hydrolase [Streptomyces sp. CB02058]OKI94077.1 hydrolase [Streptomyces sp. CB02058]